MPRNPNNPRSFSNKRVQRECVMYDDGRTVVALPLQVKSEANERGHWRAKSKRVAMQRAVVRATFNAYSVAKFGFTTVEFTRLRGYRRRAASQARSKLCATKSPRIWVWMTGRRVRSAGSTTNNKVPNTG